MAANTIPPAMAYFSQEGIYRIYGILMLIVLFV